MLHLDFSGGQAVKTVLSQHGAGVRSRSGNFHRPRGVARKKKKKTRVA